jgi:hypothetical protein
MGELTMIYRRRPKGSVWHIVTFHGDLCLSLCNRMINSSRTVTHTPVPICKQCEAKQAKEAK